MEYLYVKNHRVASGFTLLEMAIVVAIMGILLVVGVGVLDANNQRQSYEVTLRRQKQIQEAITLFVIENGRLPCPASPAQSQYNQTHGYEQASSGTCTMPANGYIFSSGAIFQGGVPSRSLSLADEYMFDGWGNKFSYVVQNNLSASAASNMEVRDGTTGTGNTYGNLIANDVQYAIISFGKNGYGAFLRAADVDLDGTGLSNGAALQNSFPADTLQLRNSGGVNGANMGVEYVQGAIAADFDDILAFKTHNQVAYECNKYSAIWNADTPTSSCSSIALR